MLNLTPTDKSAVWLTVDFYIQPSKVAEAEELFRRHVADGRADRGNLFFSMWRRDGDEAHFVSLEAWETRADIDNHDAQPHHPIFLKELSRIQAREKEVHFLNFFAEGTRV